MDDGAALMRAILREPEEDTPRLVYADWCDEQDRHLSRVRAEFIRVQVEIARLPGEEQCPQCYAAHFGGQRTNGPCRCSARLRALRRREYELWQGDLLTPEWGLPASDGKWGWHVTPRRDSQAGPPVAHLERGFVESVRCSTAAFLAQAKAIFRAHPVIRVTLSGVVRGGIVFRTSNGHENDIDRDFWEALKIPRCEASGECRMRGTHAHLTEDEFSVYLVAYGRSRAGLPPLNSRSSASQMPAPSSG
jgi:uncharacterized protein (TIGR02996 family)